MKKVFIILLVIAMLFSAIIIPVGATYSDIVDFRDLEAYGQHHYYLGDTVASAPVCDGVISTGEYSVSKSFVPLAGASGSATSGIHYVSYDDDNIYMAVEVNETEFTYGTNYYSFCFGAPMYGSFTDAASRAQIAVKMTSKSAVTIHSIEYTDHANGSPQGTSLTIDLVSSYGASRSGNKSVYELAVSREEFSKQMGFSGDLVSFFSFNFSYNSDVQWYRFGLNNNQSLALLEAHPQHTLKMMWVPHIIHLGHRIVENPDINTVSKASVRISDDENNGLRFKTYVPKDIVDSYTGDGYNMVKTKIVTLITTVENLNKANGVFTKEALESACPDKPYVEVRAFLHIPYETEGDNYVYAGSIVNIGDKDREFAAIGYIENNGERIYSSTYSTRSMSSVAVAALRDVASVGEIGDYKYPYTWGTSTEGNVITVYSPYDQAQTEILYGLAGNTAPTLRHQLSNIIAKKEGDIRIVSTNVYFHVFKNKTVDEKANVVNTMVNAISSAGGDVLLFQEMSAGTIKGIDFDWYGRLNPRLVSLGYTKVDVALDTLPTACINASNPVGVNYTPIYYNANKVRLIEAKHKYYSSIAQNPDAYLSSSKSYTRAVFEDIASGERFITITTHLTYHGNPTTANTLRVQDAKEVMAEVSSLATKYAGVPVIITGDFNCTVNSDPYSVLVSGSLCNAKDIAESVYNGSFRTSHTIGSIPNTGKAIDHVFTSKSGLNVARYQSLITNTTAAATDHIPTSIDIRFD